MLKYEKMKNAKSHSTAYKNKLSYFYYTWFFFTDGNKDRILSMGKSKESIKFMSNNESLY